MAGFAFSRNWEAYDLEFYERGKDLKTLIFCVYILRNFKFQNF